MDGTRLLDLFVADALHVTGGALRTALDLAAWRLHLLQESGGPAWQVPECRT